MGEFRPAKESFLNGLRGDKSQPNYMRKVHDLHGQLRSTVSNLSDKVGLLLKEREKDFLAAYRHHMYNVQKELQEAKQKVREAENAMKNNDQIRKLKKERDWFRGEAIRLDNLAEDMKQTLISKQEKMEATDDDRAWLVKQLKNAKKQIKILRAELEANARASSTFVTQSGMPQRNTNRGHGGMTLPPAAGSMPPLSTSDMQGQSVGWPRQSPRDLALEELQPVGMSHGERERQYQEQIYRLKQQLKMEKRRSRQLRATTTDGDSRRNELEEFFLQAIEDVRRAITRRKAKAAQLSSKQHSQHKRQRGHKRHGNGIGREASGLPLSLKDFTATDRRTVMEQLLGNEKVIRFVYENVFPASLNGAADEGATSSRTPYGMGSTA